MPASALKAQRQDALMRFARELRRRNLLRFIPVRLLKHAVYPIVAGRGASAYDPGAYFESWYADVSGEQLGDAITISHDPDAIAARFYYATVELSILRHLHDRRLCPERVLDVGSGAGHWIHFYRGVFDAHVTAVDLVPRVVSVLAEKYADDPHTWVVCGNVASTDLAVEGPFDLISAIGVMFHIVDDASWRRALVNLANLLRPGGVLLVGGQFGWLTRNVQFHTGPDGRKAYNKRIRSRRLWTAAARGAGLRVDRVVRSTSHPGIVTPENHLLALVKR